MILKWIFDRVISLLGLLILWPVLLVVAILVKIKMPGGPVLFVQKRVGKDGKLFKCHKFRTMTMKHSGSSVSVAGDSRITPLGAKLRHYKLDELPELWDVLIGDMSFVGPRPDVPGYADQLQGDDCLTVTAYKESEYGKGDVIRVFNPTEVERSAALVIDGAEFEISLAPYSFETYLYKNGLTTIRADEI